MAFELTERNSSYVMALICKNFSNRNDLPTFPYTKNLFPLQTELQKKNPKELGELPEVKFPNLEENLEKSNVNQNYLEAITKQCNDYKLKITPNFEVLEVNCYNPINVKASSSGSSKNKNEDNINLSSPVESHNMLSQAHLQQLSDHKQHGAFQISG
ncbi:uncharacterized protein LOC131607146 [Vicia villosa]|uniref:uncharacterized protein LOC131607146 n=1 Tax=Vicia villosa TaxID=3911 RepID=UPI00273C9E8D|nr:uncharacterized protein LOC131607146 [Vicia villosa]